MSHFLKSHASSQKKKKKMTTMKDKEIWRQQPFQRDVTVNFEKDHKEAVPQYCKSIVASKTIGRLIWQNNHT